jgi:hypothetical protein
LGRARCRVRGGAVADLLLLLLGVRVFGAQAHGGEGRSGEGADANANNATAGCALEGASDQIVELAAFHESSSATTKQKQKQKRKRKRRCHHTGAIRRLPSRLLTGDWTMFGLAFLLDGQTPSGVAASLLSRPTSFVLTASPASGLPNERKNSSIGPGQRLRQSPRMMVDSTHQQYTEGVLLDACIIEKRVDFRRATRYMSSNAPLADNDEFLMDNSRT